MGKAFKRIMGHVFANGAAAEHQAPENRSVNTMTEAQRTAYRQLAHQAVREGLRVFMSKDTVKAFEGLLKTKPTPKLMRKLLEEIACGGLVLKPAQQGAPTPTATRTIKPQPRAIPTVLSVDELSGGLPFSLKQAAQILNCNPQKLYNRCVKGRMHFERQKSRYVIPAAEVKRLQIVGLF